MATEQTNGIDDNYQNKRSFTEMNVTNEPLLPNTKRQKLDAKDDSEITKEDMEFLFKLKQNQNQNQHQLSSLHATHNNNVNVTTDINHTSYFAAPSIASTNNSTTMDRLSTTATIHSNPPINVTAHSDEHEHKKDKAAEKYYRQIIQRSSRVGDRYQASIIPTAHNAKPSNDNDKYGGFLQDDDVKYGGSPSNADSPATIADKLRGKRNEKRNNLDKTKEINTGNEQQNGGNNLMHFNDINEDDEDDEDEDDEDFNMDEYDGDNGGNSRRIMEGIIGRRSDWLPGDDGIPFDENTRLQYLVKWKDSKGPLWEFADELEDGYQEKIDQFEDDEMEDMLDEINDTILVEHGHKSNDEQNNAKDIGVAIETNNSCANDNL